LNALVQSLEILVSESAMVSNKLHTFSPADTIQGAIFEINLRHLLYFVVGIIPLSLSHMIIFWLKLGDYGTPEYVWRLGIIVSHAGMLLVSALMGVAGIIHKRRKFPHQHTMRLLAMIFLVLVTCLAISIVIFDQIVTNSITPYLIICIATAFVFILEPKHAAALFAGSFLLFYFGLSLTQTDPSILLSNRVNGLTAAILGFVLSLLMWRNAVKNFNNERIIEKQRIDLENRNQTLLIQSEKLATAIAARDKFFSIIGHDLKSPFNSLMGFSEILLDDWDEIDEDEKKEIIKLMKETSESTYQLLLNLLDWSRLQKEQMQLRPEDINIRDLVDNVLGQLNAQATLKDVMPEIHIDKYLVAKADEQMMNAIIRNLVSNAIKFSPRHTPIGISATMDNGKLTFCVTDHGMGISKDNLDLIFRSNLVVSTEGTENERGTGLGLQLCREFVKMHNGHIWVDSVLEKGSTFCFSIPQ
jgi:signal transduction histidine kinase